MSIPLNQILALSGVLFVLGVVGVLVRRNAIVIFMSIELMLNSANLALIAFARAMAPAAEAMRGQVLVFFVIAVAAAEVLLRYRRLILLGQIRLLGATGGTELLGRQQRRAARRTRPRGDNRRVVVDRRPVVDRRFVAGRLSHGKMGVLE